VETANPIVGKGACRQALGCSFTVRGQAETPKKHNPAVHFLLLLRPDAIKNKT
jgi:hypothetical protein